MCSLTLSLSAPAHAEVDVFSCSLWRLCIPAGVNVDVFLFPFSLAVHSPGKRICFLLLLLMRTQMPVACVTNALSFPPPPIDIAEGSPSPSMMSKMKILGHGGTIVNPEKPATPAPVEVKEVAPVEPAKKKYVWWAKWAVVCISLYN